MIPSEDLYINNFAKNESTLDFEHFFSHIFV